MFSLFLKNLFLRIIKRSQQLSLSREELIKLFSVHRYCVGIFFTFAGPSGILGSDAKQNTT